MEWSIKNKLEKKLERTKKRQKWHKHFAFLPVTIGTTVHWLETVYRKEHAYEGNWRYGTLMDILKEEETQASLNVLKGQAMAFNIPTTSYITKGPADEQDP